jgi:hypothetical protein
MDGSQFDTLIKRLATTPLTRPTALRRVAASVAALAGLTLAVEPSAAKKKRKVCHCTDEKSTSCKTIEVGKKAARKHLKKHDCDSRGECKGVSGCCLADTLGCTTNTQCCSRFCGDGTCRPTGSCAVQGTACTGGAPACCTGECLDSLCRPTGACKELGDGCGGGPPFPDCCSGNCAGGICKPAP